MPTFALSLTHLPSPTPSPDSSAIHHRGYSHRIITVNYRVALAGNSCWWILVTVVNHRHLSALVKFIKRKTETFGETAAISDLRSSFVFPAPPRHKRGPYFFWLPCKIAAHYGFVFATDLHDHAKASIPKLRSK